MEKEYSYRHEEPKYESKTDPWREPLKHEPKYDPWREPPKHARRKPPRRPGRSHAKLRFLHIIEILTIVLSFLASSRIARFLAAKISLSVIVEVTDKFGAAAGHRLSTLVSMIIAEPKIIAVIVTGIWLCVDLVLWIVWMIRSRNHRRRR